MRLIFKLSMPQNNAWNGKWSGEGNLYAVIRNFGTAQKTRVRLQPIIDEGYFYYNFGDGWGAAVEVYECVSMAEARSIMKRSRGFCGYEWMIDSILTYGDIRIKERA